MKKQQVFYILYVSSNYGNILVIVITKAVGLDTKFWELSPFGWVTLKMYPPKSLRPPPPPQFPILAIFNFYYEIGSVL